MSDPSILRLQKELHDLQWNGAPYRFDDKNMKHVHALITGPPHTPYASLRLCVYRLGMFDFVFNIGDDYPQSPPKVNAMTTSNGRVRFNPNIYATEGNDGEKWSAAHGLLSVLVSIQSLLSDNPYHNEPGHEKEKDTSILSSYNAKLVHETLRVSVCDRLEEYMGWKTPDVKVDGLNLTRQFCTCRAKSPFVDVTKNMFLMYKNLYDDIIDTQSKDRKDGTAFYMARFEHPNNRTEGSFQYAAIRKRLSDLQTALLDEPVKWIAESEMWIKNETTTWSNLKSQYEQIKASMRYDTSILIDLEGGNPFAWNLAVIKLPNTYDGGVFRAQMVFHHAFPDVAPRIRFQSEVFHPHVSKDGIPYIRVHRPDNVREYLDALGALFMRDPLTDPTTHLNLGATRMWFGTREMRRDFNRNARRCGQKTLE
ncbi:hypothetical protein PhCBS80983_g05962 [Powellomyces hirtus]|uniref:UBC core domain-containing protein n=1 Tax=Powellomyces hirtus TaxID=109895 RepID=A0A507DSW4_9FUNG|nr:hypothetical protein PhCBS80983_g05962 [Powellomyces hirtus]